MRCFVALLLVGSAWAQGVAPVPAADPRLLAPVPADVSFAPANPALPTIYIVGDSTASDHPASEGTGPLAAQGWGPYLAAFFDPAKVNVVNAAFGGRSSRSYRREGIWTRVLAQVRPHDVVLIQMGQNDTFAINDATRARGTIPGTGEETQEIDNLMTHQHEVVHTFGWYVRQYVEETKARGAVAIVLSVTPRNVWKDGRMELGVGDYRAAAATIAAAEHVDFADVTSVMAQEYEKLGEAKTASLYHQTEKVHVNNMGAGLNAEWVVETLKGLPDAPVSRFLSAKGMAVRSVAVK